MVSHSNILSCRSAAETDASAPNVADARGMASLQDPSTLFFQRDGVRRLIITSYWIVILLAIPLWWNITSIERLSLPWSRVNDQTQTLLAFPTTIQLDPSLAAQRPSLLHDLQGALAERASKELSVSIAVGAQTTEPGLYHISPSTSGEIRISGRHLFIAADQSRQYAFPRLGVLLN